MRDGNEVGGVPVVLRDAPLGTYLGWNITAAGFHKGQICNYRRRHDSVREDERRAPGQRRSAPLARGALWQSRGLRRAVSAAAANAMAQGFLLQADTTR